jgi:hypothetical protein
VGLCSLSALLRLVGFCRHRLDLEQEDVEEVADVLHHAGDKVQVDEHDENHVHGRCHDRRDQRLGNESHRRAVGVEDHEAKRDNHAQLRGERDLAHVAYDHSRLQQKYKIKQSSEDCAL